MKTKIQKLAILYSKQAVDSVAPHIEELNSVKNSEFAPVAIHFLNRNQNREGIAEFQKTYEDMVLVLADTSEGEMVEAAKELCVDVRPACSTPAMLTAWASSLV